MKAPPVQDTILELDIPEGFALAQVGPQKQLILVPTYMIPTAQEAIHARHAKKSSGGDKASPLPVPLSPYAAVYIGDLKVKVPPNPPPSERELLNMHAEVECLRQRFGISYKAACHRLYYQYHQGVKTTENNAKAWADMERSLKDSLDYMFDYEELVGGTSPDKGKGRETD